MASIKQRNIRRFYYVVNMAIFLLMSTSLAISYFSSTANDYRKKVELITANMINQKKLYLSTVVYGKINEIEELIKSSGNEIQSIAGSHLELISFMLRCKFTNGEELLQSIHIPDYLSDLNLGKMDYALINLENNSVISSSSDSDQILQKIKRAPVSISEEIYQNIYLYLFFPDEDFDLLVQQRAADNIRNTLLPDNGYIWVNKILNYSGGDNYGIRLVHPNLPDTEGALLSTKDEDIKGNLPYKAELDGINKDGETYYEYFFQKMNSEVVSRKLSYGRLFKDFDWIIATGVYLDDVDILIEREQEEIVKTYRKGAVVFVITVMILFALASFFLIHFEKRIIRLLNRYNHELEGKNKELTAEKGKVEKALNKIQEIAYLDQLTSLWNRRAMYIRLQEEASRSTRSEQKFCLIMADVDNFKQINDKYGHNAGDFVLKELAGVFSDAMRVEDSIARWGGEEFLFLVNSSSLEEGALVAEKLRKAVEEKNFLIEGRQYNVTLTFGVSEFFIDDNIDSVINSADAKLYKGKAKGRNRVEY